MVTLHMCCSVCAWSVCRKALSVASVTEDAILLVFLGPCTSFPNIYTTLLELWASGWRGRISGQVVCAVVRLVLARPAPVQPPFELQNSVDGRTCTGFGKSGSLVAVSNLRLLGRCSPITPKIIVLARSSTRPQLSVQPERSACYLAELKDWQKVQGRLKQRIQMYLTTLMPLPARKTDEDSNHGLNSRCLEAT